MVYCGMSACLAHLMIIAELLRRAAKRRAAGGISRYGDIQQNVEPCLEESLNELALVTPDILKMDRIRHDGVECFPNCEFNSGTFSSSGTYSLLFTSI